MAPLFDPELQHHDLASTKKEVTILVTGFCPFQDLFPVNPSFEITRLLPETLPSASHHRTAVRIIAYGSPIRVAYEDVRQLVPPLHESYHGTVDMVLHIGMASGRSYYTLERFAHRDGYQRNTDLDGKVPPVDEGKKLFSDCPDALQSSLDYAEVLHLWQENATQYGTEDGEAIVEAAPDCRPSNDAGRYLCEYIYFNSLAYFGRRSKCFTGEDPQMSRPVLFLHVPAESDERTLAKGKTAAIALLRAMADSFVVQATNGIS